MHRPSKIGYETAYPGWFLNRDEVLAAAAGAGQDLVREFLIWESAVVPGAPEQPEFRGFLFSPAGRSGADG
jgi:hypothetical protein